MGEVGRSTPPPLAFAYLLFRFPFVVQVATRCSHHRESTPNERSTRLSGGRPSEEIEVTTTKTESIKLG